jgi:hypothetical protein
MKRILALVAALLFLAPGVFAGVVEDWSGVQSGANTGTYMDSNGSKIDFAVDAGPKAGQKALKLTSNLAQGGYCGIWHNLSADMSKAANLTFMAKSTIPGTIQVALKDAYNVQYIATAQVGADWAQVSIPLASFRKDPYYTPPDAITGHLMDLSKTSGMNLAPQMAGAAVLFFGPVGTDGLSAASAAPAAATASTASPSLVEDWSDVKAGQNTGAYQDSAGSKIDFSVVTDTKNKQKALKLVSDLVKGDGNYCGIWHNISADLSKAANLKFMAKSSVPGDIQIALVDAYNVQYITTAQIGGSWAYISVPLSGFHKDPYYTPPDAITGHAMDLSKTTHMNIAPQTQGEVILMVGPIRTDGKAAGVVGSSGAAAEAKELSFVVSPDKVNGPISPYVYGLNRQDPTGMNATVRRLGGNRMTGYNWTNNYSSAGTDWKNFSDDWLSVSAKYPDGDQPGAYYRHFVEENQKAGMDSLVTIQMAGYVAADKKGEVKKEETAPSPRWAKLEFEKKAPFTLKPKPDSPVVYCDEFVNYLVQTFQPASKGGIKFYDLDNETALWYSKHPRLHPKQLTYPEILDKTIQLSHAILKVDPSATILGPVAYGWQEFVSLQESPDYKEMNATYGSYLDYYLAKLQEREKKDGQRLVHVLDLHWYPEAQGNGMRVTDGDHAPDSIDARVQAPRSLWDSTYKEKSWITQWSTHNQPIRLIPWVQEKIAKNYPGTKLSFSEYDYGAGDHISGGIAQADVLGIFGKYGVYMSNYWGDLNPYNQAAFKLYRNYDGKNSTFGGTSVSAETGDVSLASIYAATDPAQPGTLWLVVLNKSQKALLNGQFKIEGKSSYKIYVSYGFDGKSADIQKLKEGTIDGDHFNYSLAPLSATLFVCKGGN